MITLEHYRQQYSHVRTLELIDTEESGEAFYNQSKAYNFPPIGVVDHGIRIYQHLMHHPLVFDTASIAFIFGNVTELTIQTEQVVNLIRLKLPLWLEHWSPTMEKLTFDFGGSVYDADTTRAFKRIIQAINQMTALCELHLFNLGDLAIPTEEPLHVLHRLTAFTWIADSGNAHEVLRQLGARIRNLRLRIFFNNDGQQLTDINPQLQKLTHLTVSYHNYFPTEYLPRYFSPLASLIFLDLTNVDKTVHLPEQYFGDEAFRVLANICPNLRHLKIHKNHIVDALPANYRGEIDVMYEQRVGDAIGNELAEIFRNVQQLRSIEELTIFDDEFTAGASFGVTFQTSFRIAMWTMFPNLRSLVYHLYGNERSGHPAPPLAQLRIWRNLLLEHHPQTNQIYIEFTSPLGPL